MIDGRQEEGGGRGKDYYSSTGSRTSDNTGLRRSILRAFSRALVQERMGLLLKRE